MSDSAPRASTAWGPLARPLFRALWIAALASNIGTLMQGVAAAWLMTSLTRSPVPVALLTTMANLPLFLVGLPAGALADLIDRRWLVLVTQIWMLVVALMLAALAIANATTPFLLLALTFLISLGGALSAPAWQAIMPELVPRNELATAIALNSAGFNLARAIGPAIGGLIVAASGSAAVFLLNAASFIGVIAVMWRWQPAARELPRMPERVGGAVAAGLRFARYAPALRAVLLRTATWIFPASALLALLPVVAAHELGLEALGYGVLLASMGLGAVGGAFALPWLRRRLTLEQLGLLLILVFALGLSALALLRNLVALNLVLLLMGAAWLIINSFLNVAAQTIAPAWVQARALGVYLLVSQGGLAAGSAVWGFVAERAGAPIALLAAAALLIVGLPLALRWPLPTAENLDLSPSPHWPAPDLAHEPAAAAGPVLVQTEYRVEVEQQAAFIEAMAEVELVRRRDGAARWGLFRDAADPERLVETFLVASWAEHLRQHERITVADRSLEEQALALLKAGTQPISSYLLAAASLQAVDLHEL